VFKSNSYVKGREGMSTILVTGIGGMGLELAHLLIEKEYKILAVSKDDAKLDELKDAYPQQAHIVPCNFNQADSFVDLERIIKDVSNLEGFVHLAGVSMGARQIEDLSEEDWRSSFEVNVDAAYRICKMVVPIFKQKKRGSIVLVGSPVGVIGAKKAAYSASKSALHGLGVSLASTLGEFNIRVNTVLPGPTITGMTEDWTEEKRKKIAANTFLKRLTTPVEIASIIHFLLSEESSCITGSMINATAGSIFGGHS